MKQSDKRILGWIVAGLAVVALLLQLPGLFEDLAVGEDLLGLLPNLAMIVIGAGLITLGVLLALGKLRSSRN